MSLPLDDMFAETKVNLANPSSKETFSDTINSSPAGLMPICQPVYPVLKVSP